MASTKKTNTKRKTTTKKRTSAKRPVKGKKNRQDVFEEGVLIAIVAAVCIFLLCCNIGLCGKLGGYISGFFFGLFGLVQYLIPVFICAAMIIAVLHDYSARCIRKITLSVVFACFLCALCHMSVHIDWGFQEIAKSYLYSMEHKTAGGLIGALLTSIFYPFLSTAGTWVLVLLVLVLLFILIAGTSVIDVAHNIYDAFSLDEDEMVVREEFYAKKQERRKVQQQERKEARIQRYQEAAEREQEQLDEIEERRKRFRSGRVFEVNTETAAAKSDDLTMGKAKKATTVLHNQGLCSEKETTEKTRPAKTARQEKAKTPAPKQEKINEVTVSSDGELHITGLVEEPLEREPAPEKKQVRAKKAEHAISGTANATAFDKLPTTKVREVTAEFSDASSWEKETSSGIDATAQEPAKPVSHRRTKETAKEAQREAQNTANEIAKTDAKADYSSYQRPLLELLERGKRVQGNTKAQLQATAKKLEETLDSFGVHVTVTDVSCGPAVTRYEMLPEQGTRVNKITSLADDIKLNLAVADIRIEAPIPGKAAIGIEVPNKEAQPVSFRDLLEGSDFMASPGDLSFAVGKDISGEVVISDIGKMPHVLIAGATGSGKSVCINTLIMSLLYKSHPDDVKLIMIDPKVVELSVYNGIPHLLIPVVTDPKKASGALNWAVAEMEARYKKFAECNVRNLEGYNKKVAQLDERGENPEKEFKKMPKIVIIVDELADLMMVAHGEVEDAIVRLSQLARAAGIHLVIATQRPSVDVITGLIKANVPSRIAFAVSSGVDSRTILDMNGAEKLLGKGDMLFAPSGIPKPIRVQGAFISDKEVGRVVEFLKAQELNVQYNDNITREINCGPRSVRDANKDQERDEYFVDAAKFIIEKEKASIGMLQRVYKIGFNRAARIMDQLSEAGVVGPEEGTKPRQILMTMDEFEQWLAQEN